jgi:FkbM family methyltransferase
MTPEFEGTSPILRGTMSALRAWIRWTQTARPDVGWPERVVRACLMVPVFSLLLVILRVRALVWGRPTVLGTTVAGDTFRCHPPDLVQLYIWLFGVWEPDLTEFIGERLAPGDGFVDVGANIGVFSLLASRRVGAEGSVTAIEASPTVYRELLDTLALNGHPANVRAVNVAAADRTGSVTVYSGPSKNTGLTTTVASRGFAREATVPTQSLGDILTEHEIRDTRLVKIDVEGGEPGVVAGMTRFVEHSRRDVEILIELSPHWWAAGTPGPSAVLAPLVRAGFNAYEIRNSYWPWRYLWPRRASRPRRVRRDLDTFTERVDLVMSRVDAESL